MSETLKQKVEWMLSGGYLTDIGDDKLYAYGIDTDTRVFYSISKRSVKAKKPKRITQDQHLPLEDIDRNMEILRSTVKWRGM